MSRRGHGRRGITVGGGPRKTSEIIGDVIALLRRRDEPSQLRPTASSALARSPRCLVLVATRRLAALLIKLCCLGADKSVVW